MQAKDLKKKKLPDAPGVYFFLGRPRSGVALGRPRSGVGRGQRSPKSSAKADDRARKILYIGKATSLRDRVKSYFSRDLIEARGAAVVKMVGEATTVNYSKTDSVLEALILEANLIKKHKPPYNVREKDDKSFNYIVITKEEWPRVMVVRGKDLSEKYPPRTRKYLFGPFPNGYVFKEAMKLIRKLFPFYDTSAPIPNMISKAQAGKLRFNRSIGLYPKEDVSRLEYARTIQHIRLFFEGKKPQLLRKLEQEMKTYAKQQEFEKAERLKRTMFGLRHIQDISLLRRDVRELAARHSFRIEAYDIAHINGTSSVGVMVVVEDGEVKKSDYRNFRIKEAVAGSDVGALEEVLRRRLRHDEWLLPSLIVVDGGKLQINAADRVLREFGYRIPIVSVVKDERHRARQVLGSAGKGHEDAVLLANNEAHRFAIGYHRKLRRLDK